MESENLKIIDASTAMIEVYTICSSSSIVCNLTIDYISLIIKHIGEIDVYRSGYIWLLELSIDHIKTLMDNYTLPESAKNKAYLCLSLLLELQDDLNRNCNKAEVIK